ncbi:MAG TPA: hypothetical protein DCZ75_17520 [Geobacter sp.]|nr:hypothetical protein [Geobacter sp.]
MQRKRSLLPLIGMQSSFSAFGMLSLLTVCLSSAYAEVKCLNGQGSAAIVNDDISSAKMEATARARWAALEEAVGVEVRSQSVVENSALLDDMVTMQGKGTISSSKVLSEKRDQGMYHVTVNACIEPSKAAEAVASLALNNSVAVFLPARRPRVLQESESTARVSNSRKTAKASVTSQSVTEEQEESNILSDTLIEKLVEQGYTVTDIAPTGVLDAEEVDKAIKSGNFTAMRSLIGKYLSNLLLIGKVDYTVSQKKGEEIGYGIEAPFNRVTVRLTYRLLTRERDSGKLVIVGAGTSEAKGNAANLEDAAAKGMENLSTKVIPALLDKFARQIKGVSRKIAVKVDGLDAVEGTFDVKQVIGNAAWVSDVEATGLNEYRVSYPENSIYLANSLSRNPKLKLVEFSPYSIRLSYRK